MCILNKYFTLTTTVITTLSKPYTIFSCDLCFNFYKVTTVITWIPGLKTTQKQLTRFSERCNGDKCLNVCEILGSSGNLFPRDTYK